MKITLKDSGALKTLVAGPNGIDDRLENFFNTYGGKTIEPNDFSVQFMGGVQQFSFSFFTDSMAYTNIEIPEVWTNAIDLEENDDIYFCKRCNYKIKSTQKYPFVDGKQLIVDDNGTSDTTDDTYTKSIKTFKFYIDNHDTVCPICFSKNSFIQVSI